MRIEQLKCFLEVVKTGSFTKAADNLFLSQQGLSGAIARLEKELGLPLFIRGKKGAVLTEDGQALSSYAAAIIEKYADFEEALWLRQQRHEKNLTGTLTLCATSILSGAFLPDIISLFHEQYPKVHLNCLEMTLDNIIQKVASVPSCLGFVLSGQDDDHLKTLVQDHHLISEAIFTDELVACISAASPLAQQPYLPLDAFNRQDRINFNFQLNPPVQDTPSEQALYMSNNTALHKKLVLENIAIGGVPKRYFRQIFDTNAIIPLSIIPPIKLCCYIICNPNSPSPSLKAFGNLLRDYLQTLDIR